MAHRVHTYPGKDIIVRYDANRCIHAAECIARLNAVFDTSQRRWVQPDNAPASDVAEAVVLCPTGALHFEPGDGREPEGIPTVNTVTLVTNGPLYVRGNIELVGSDGHVILTDTRLALCRCGKSKIKPFCDNSHHGVDFHADGTYREHTPEPITNGQQAPKLIISVEADGPYTMTGAIDIYGAHGVLLTHSTETQLCRCGASEDKPYCDGSHRVSDFTAE